MEITSNTGTDLKIYFMLKVNNRNIIIPDVF